MTSKSTKPLVNPLDSQPSTSLTPQFNEIRSLWNSAKEQLLASPPYRVYSESRHTLTHHYYHPLKHNFKHIYDEAPKQTADLKVGLIQSLSFGERFLALNLLAVGTALVGFRNVNRLNVWITGVRTFRNTVLVYALGGLMIAPEIYNPLISKMAWQS